MTTYTTTPSSATVSRKKFSKNFTQFSNTVFKLPLSPESKLFLICLHQYQHSPEGIFPSLTKMGLDCSFSRWTAGKCLTETLEKSFIFAEKTVRHHGRFANTRYTINYAKIEEFKTSTTPYKRPKTPKKPAKLDSHRVASDRVVSDHVVECNSNKKRSLNKKKENNKENVCDLTRETPSEQPTHTIQINREKDANSQETTVRMKNFTVRDSDLAGILADYLKSLTKETFINFAITQKTVDSIRKTYPSLTTQQFFEEFEDFKRSPKLHELLDINVPTVDKLERAFSKFLSPRFTAILTMVKRDKPAQVDDSEEKERLRQLSVQEFMKNRGKSWRI